MRAARMLNDVVEKFLREHPQSKDSRVVVRIYADVTSLSKQLAKSKLIGLEKRSIMPFAAGFTRAMGHYDFVDALDEEGTRFKIRGMLTRVESEEQLGVTAPSLRSSTKVEYTQNDDPFCSWRDRS